MFVLNTLKKESKTKIKTPVTYHMIGGIFFILSMYLYLINSTQDGDSRTLIAVSLFLLGLLFFYMAVFHVTIDISEKHLVYKSSFCFIPITEITIDKSDIVEVKCENHSHGQTVQKRLKLIIITNKKEYTFGVINSVTRFEELRSLLLNS